MVMAACLAVAHLPQVLFRQISFKPDVVQIPQGNDGGAHRGEFAGIG